MFVKLLFVIWCSTQDLSYRKYLVIMSQAAWICCNRTSIFKFDFSDINGASQTASSKGFFFTCVNYWFLVRYSTLALPVSEVHKSALCPSILYGETTRSYFLDIRDIYCNRSLQLSNLMYINFFLGFFLQDSRKIHLASLHTSFPGYL